MRSLAIAFLAAVSLVPLALATEPTAVSLGVNRSTVIDFPEGFRRISVANGDLAEAVAVSSKELLINGKAPGTTSVMIWDTRGARHAYTVTVAPDNALIESLQQQIQQETGSGVTLELDGETLLVKGTAPTEDAAFRAYSIATTVPKVKVVNLLRVPVPDAEPQILLKVRFADVDRSLSAQLGVNLFQLNPTKGIASSTTGQFGAPPTVSGFGTASVTGSLSDFLNIFYFRPDLNLGAVLEDLEAKNILQVLAEPNLLTRSGHQASFLAGGEFPFPTIQGGASGVGQITIQFKEFGIKLNFLPSITPRGTIRLQVTPEVSSLDYSNGLTVSGYTVPGLATKRVTTNVELKSGQSFAIAGLLNDQLNETLDKMPGIANIPVLGKLFQSRSVQKNHSELLVVVTPEVVNPLPAGQTVQTMPMPEKFIPGSIPKRLGNDSGPQLGAVQTPIPVEELDEQQAEPAQPAGQPGAAATGQGNNAQGAAAAPPGK